MGSSPRPCSWSSGVGWSREGWGRLGCGRLALGGVEPEVVALVFCSWPGLRSCPGPGPGPCASGVRQGGVG